MTREVDPASILFNLEGHVVLSAERTAAGRSVLVERVERVEREGACRPCGGYSSVVHSRPVHRVRNIQCGGGSFGGTGPPASPGLP